MSGTTKVTGTGAVNERGEVIVFVGEWADYDRFAVEGDAIVLGAATGETFSRTYGPLCLAAARESGRVLAVEVTAEGKPGRSSMTEAVRGTGRMPHGR